MVMKTGMLESGTLGSNLCKLSTWHDVSHTRYPVVADVTIQDDRNIQTY